jgi:hypothetical protein
MKVPLNNQKEQVVDRGQLVVALERRKGQLPNKETLGFLEKKLKQPSTNHALLIKHLYKDCVLMRKFFSHGFKGVNRPKRLPQPWTTTGKVKRMTVLGAFLLQRSSKT